MKTTIAEILNESAAMKSRIAESGELCAAIEKGAEALLRTARGGGTIYACGNGGSACDAMHLSEELVARYKRERPGIRAMHFGDPGVLTCWSNDYDFKGAFERQARTFCGEKDALVAISTSGNSENVLRAVRAAKERGCYCIGLAGKDGGKLKEEVDLCVVMPSTHTERIQEGHITVIHIWCELLETR